MSDHIIKVQAIRDLGGDYDRVADDRNATEFGVYAVDMDGMGMSMHIISYPTRSQAEAFILGLDRDLLELAGGNTESLPDRHPSSTDLSAYHAQEVATQAAQFALSIHSIPEITQSVMDGLSGMAGLYELCADEALKFCRHHWQAMIGVEDYWDAHDWYETSDAWYAEHLEPVLYPK